MSVYIGGMEMPKSRGEYGLILYVDSDGTATVEGSYCRFEGEPFDAVPVPPHGQLGDLDALQKQIDIARNYGMIGKTAHYKLQKLIKEATTIIPADPTEDGKNEADL